MVVVLASWVGRFAQRHAGPLVIAHRGRPAVGQEVHVDALRGDLKEVVPSLTQQTISLFPRRPADRLNHFDLKRLRGKLHGSDRKSTRLNSSHTVISYAVFCLKKKKKKFKNAMPPHKLNEQQKPVKI